MATQYEFIMTWCVEIMFTTTPYQSRQDRQTWYAKGDFCDKGNECCSKFPSHWQTCQLLDVVWICFYFPLIFLSASWCAGACRHQRGPSPLLHRNSHALLRVCIDSTSSLINMDQLGTSLGPTALCAVEDFRLGGTARREWTSRTFLVVDCRSEDSTFTARSHE